LESFFNVFEILEFNWFNRPHEMAVMKSVCIVITYHTPVIALKNRMVDIRQVVPDNPSLLINPYFTTQNSVTVL